MRKIMIILVSVMGLILIFLIYNSGLAAELFEKRLEDKYVLSEGYITKFYGATTPAYYIRLNEENIQDIFKQAESELQITSIAGLDEIIQKCSSVEHRQIVLTTENKKESLELFSFVEEYDNKRIIYELIKRADEYYLNVTSYKFKDNENTLIEYCIITTRDGLHISDVSKTDEK